jgi:uncharacterized protein (UPF0303 family)
MLNHISKIESEFIFSSFSVSDAHDLGAILTKRAVDENLPIIIDISSPLITYYHFANVGSTSNNEAFIQRKRNTVLLFHHSTWWVNYKVENDTIAMHEKYGTNDEDYSILYGGWPIIVKDLGVVGSICISGLTQEADNQLIIDALNTKFKKNINPNLVD